MDPSDPGKCIVLVPFRGNILPECDQGLRELESRGYRVERNGSFSAIDQGRSQMATEALEQGFEETLWIDSDIAFDPNAVEQLRAHKLSVVCGIYPVKGRRALACHVMPGTEQVVFGQKGGLIELESCGAGFMLVRREAYLNVQAKFELPLCNEQFNAPLVPYFLPMIVATESGPRYLAEDYSFCYRVRECGYSIMGDTSIRLWHMGSTPCSWEASPNMTGRHDSYTLKLDEQIVR